MAKPNRKNQQPDFRSQTLADALEKQDMAAIAYALRNDRMVVPLMKPGQSDKPTDAGEVWTFRQPETGKLALLLFSDAKNKPASLPPFVGLQDGLWLHTFLRTHGEAIDTVFFDIAGPHPLQAAPDEIMRVLDIETT
ncbi:dehydrogenase [Paramicrobacterium fandaimingii]|uniref:dehydrogenase n=1 Tax=Paramicrobacterium fandaimingii TaxID=2708079 RepID=UPI00141E16CF|nr:dehydrogenase [Microbacterium fandaimingii]